MIRDRDNAPLVIMISGTNTFRGTLRILRNGTIEKRETMPIFLSFECKFIFLIDFDEWEQIDYEEKKIKS